MGNIEKRWAIKDEARKRVRLLKFGDEVTNICAGEQNPSRVAYFVRLKNKGSEVECTDKKGSFWLTECSVIYPGNLDKAKCAELFQPVWDAEFGS
jgi:hypothetical protein